MTGVREQECEQAAACSSSRDMFAFLAGPTLPWQLRANLRCPGQQCLTSCSMSEPTALSRRQLLLAATAGLALALPATSHATDLYEVHKPRYIPQGRPQPVEAAPTFDAKAAFPIGPEGDDLLAIDISKGQGDAVERGTLVVAAWKISLADGTVVEETPSPSIFRVGTGQVYPGLDAALMGMRTSGSQRRIKASAASFFSDITNGERSLVPSDAVVYANVAVIRSNPYGPQ
jgi:hypothetical protein